MKKLCMVVLVMFAACVLVGYAAPAKPAAKPAGKTIDQIMLDVEAGAKNIQSITGEQTVEFMLEGSMVKAVSTFKAKTPDKFHSETAFPIKGQKTEKILTVCDGKTIWQYVPGTKEERKVIKMDLKAISGKLDQYQKQFLSVASRILKPHGRVAYSVCTISIGECEEVVAFAEAHCDLELVEQPLYLGSPGFNAVSRPSLVQRFHPHIHGAGYFIALFEKRGKS